MLQQVGVDGGEDLLGEEVENVGVLLVFSTVVSLLTVDFRNLGTGGSG